MVGNRFTFYFVLKLLMSFLCELNSNFISFSILNGTNKKQIKAEWISPEFKWIDPKWRGRNAPSDNANIDSNAVDDCQ